jgi:hypothetical protein
MSKNLAYESTKPVSPKQIVDKSTKITDQLIIDTDDGDDHS